MLLEAVDVTFSVLDFLIGSLQSGPNSIFNIWLLDPLGGLARLEQVGLDRQLPSLLLEWQVGYQSSEGTVLRLVSSRPVERTSLN